MATRFTPTCWICDKNITVENCKIDEYGKGVCAECYAAKLAHPKGKSIVEKEARSWELCALANSEKDAKKLAAIVQQMNQLLEELAQIKHFGKPTDSLLPPSRTTPAIPLRP